MELLQPNTFVGAEAVGKYFVCPAWIASDVRDSNLDDLALHKFSFFVLGLKWRELELRQETNEKQLKDMLGEARSNGKELDALAEKVKQAMEKSGNQEPFRRR